jgi:hypothetical protein
MMFSNVVTWECKKQRTIALSSAEAEYYALTEATKSVLHFRNLASENMSVKEATPLLVPRKTETSAVYVDNKGTIYMAENDIHNQKTKHIDVRYRFITHHIKEKTVSLHFVRSADNMADMFTKPLGRQAFERLNKRLIKLDYVTIPVKRDRKITKRSSKV